MPYWYYAIKQALNPRTLYYKFIYGVQNLIIWFPIIWRDRAWDEYYLLEMLHKKFTLMEKQHRFHSLSVDSEKTAHKLRICKVLTKRLLEERYFDYSRIPDNWTIWKSLSPEIFDKISEENKREDRMINQDLDLLFKIMRKNIRRWWD